jgi:hypothetical protein
MGGSSRKKRARRAAAAAAAAEAARQQAEQTRIRTETESMQRDMGEELAGRKRARQRGGMGLLSTARITMGNDEETLG